MSRTVPDFSPNQEPPVFGFDLLPTQQPSLYIRPEVQGPLVKCVSRLLLQVCRVAGPSASA